MNDETAVNGVSAREVDDPSASPLNGYNPAADSERKASDENRRFLFSVAEKIRIGRGTVELFGDIADALGTHLGLHRCLFNEIDLDSDTETVHRDFARDGESVAGEHRLSNYSPIAADSMSRGRTVINRDSQNDPRTAEYFEKTYGPARELAYIAVPMLREGKWVASLWCSDDKPRNWTDDEVALVEHVAERTWAAVERLRAEETLRASEEKYRTLFESIDEGFVIVEMIFDETNRPVDYRFAEANPAFTRLTGLPDDALGKTARELVPDLEEFWFETYGGVALTGKPARFEHESEAMGRWFDVYASRVGGMGSNRVAIVFNDISERRRREGNLAFLAEVSKDLVRMTNIDQTMNTLGEKIAGHFGLSACAFAELDDAADIAYINHGWHRADVQSLLGTYRMEVFMTPEVVRSCRAGEPVVVRDVFVDSRTDGEQYAALNIGSFVSMPLVQSGEWRFLLVIYRSEPYDWRGDEIELLSELATRIWTRLERAKAEEAVRARNRQLDQLSRASGHLIGREKTGTEILQTVFEELAETLQTEFFYNYLVADEPETLCLATSGGLSDEQKEFFDRIRFGEFLCGMVAQRGERLVVENLHECKYEEAAALREAGVLAYAGFPLLAHGGLIGTVAFATRSRTHFRTGELQMIQTVCDQAAVTLARVRAEKALHESRERLQLATDAMKAVVYDWDIGPDRIWRSKELADLLGFEPADEIATNEWWRSLLHPEDAERAVELVRAAIDGDADRFEDEYRIRHSDGHYLWVSDRGIFIRDENGKAVRCVGSVRYIGARKAAEDALRASEVLSRVTRLELETTYQTAPFGMCQLDRELRYTRINEKLAELNGIPAADHLGRRLEEMVPDLAPRIADKFRRVMETGEPIIDIEISGETAAQPGVKRWWLESWFPQRDIHGETVGINVVAHEITEKKVAEDRLKESQERFRLAQKAGGVGVWDWDAVTNETYWSETMWSFYGVEPQAANPADSFWSDHLHPEDRGRVEQHVAEVLGSDARNYNDEFRIVADEGTTRWIEATATILRDADGKPTRMYGVNIDITERKAAEERVRASEVQLRLVTDAMPALISYVDREMRYRFVNRTYTEWFGQPYGELVGRTIKEVAGKRAYESVKPHIDRVMSGEEHSFQTTLNYKTAGTRFVQVSYVPDKLVDGSVVGFYALVSDLSDLKRSQDMLQATQERYRNVVIGFTDHAIFSTDAEGRIDSWNPGAVNIFGYSADEAVGQNAEILFTPEDRAKGVPAEELQKARATGRASDERWHVRKDGSRFYASGMTTPLYFGRTLSGFAKIASDLTEKKRHAEALQRAHDELEVRVAERTRELAKSNKSLIAEVQERKAAERESIELLQRVVTTQEDERTRIARDLHDQLGQRLTALRLKIASLPEAFSDEALLRTRSERLQEISQAIDSEVSFLAWELRPAALDELGLAEAIKAHMNEWSRHYEIVADFHASGLGDQRLGQIVETHLYRILQEALNNTAKHASATEVTILLERMHNDAVLIVEDNGVGFDLRDGTRVKSSGKGLGLAGMRERASLIGGELEIESSKGNGTAIFVRVPIGNVEGENENA